MDRRELLAAERGTLWKEAEARVALVYPSPYRAAMSSLGYQQIYRTLHAMPGVAADRAMLPDPQERTEARFDTLETGQPVGSYPIIAYSVAYELELAGLVRLLQADPYELEALTALGRVLLEDGRTQQALEAFSRVLRFDPEHSAALYNQGTCFARQRQFDDAVQAWERVIELDPDGPFATEARSRARSARDLQHIFAAAS